jgi:predicted CopG family antitoxin
MSTDRTTVNVKNETWKRLMLRKEPGDSFDDVIQSLLDDVEDCEDENGQEVPA